MKVTLNFQTNLCVIEKEPRDGKCHYHGSKTEKHFLGKVVESLNFNGIRCQKESMYSEGMSSHERQSWIVGRDFQIYNSEHGKVNKGSQFNSLPIGGKMYLTLVSEVFDEEGVG